MTARRITGLAALLALASGAAFALSPAVHSVDWFRTHQTERDATLKTCQNDHSFDNQAECRNALSGAHAALADSLAPEVTKDPLADPAYYGNDAGKIAMILSMCGRHEALPAWCTAAQSASAQRNPIK